MCPRIQDRHILGKVLGVAGDKGELVLEGGRRDEAVHRGKFAARALMLGVEHGPRVAHGEIHGKNAPGRPPLDALIPLFDFLSALAPVHQMDSLEHLAERKSGNSEFRIVVRKPLKHGGVWLWLG